MLSRERTKAVIIPEPFGVDRVCVGHRGVYWFEVIARGPHRARQHAVSRRQRDRRACRTCSTWCATSSGPALFGRVTAMPVVPEGSRHATININGIDGGQPVDDMPSPCVADRCRVVFDRRFLMEEGLERTRAEIAALVAKAQSRMPDVKFSIEDRLIFEPTRTPEDAPVIGALTDAIEQVTGRQGRRSSRARAPTITSTSRASPACRTASPMARANWTWRISLMNTAVSTTSSPPRKCWRSR